MPPRQEDEEDESALKPGEIKGSNDGEEGTEKKSLQVRNKRESQPARKSLQKLEEEQVLSKDNDIPTLTSTVQKIDKRSGPITSQPKTKNPNSTLSLIEQQQQQRLSTIPVETGNGNVNNDHHSETLVQDATANIAGDEETPIQAYKADEDTNRRKSAMKRGEDNVLIEGVVEEEPKSTNTRTCAILFLFGVVCLVFVGLGFGISRRKKNDNNNGDEANEIVDYDHFTLIPSSAPTTATQLPSSSPSTSMVPSSMPSNVPTLAEFASVVEQIAIEFPDLPVDFNDSNSPSYRAAEWMVGQFPILPIPPDDLLAILDFRQRYALSVFYYATGGDDIIGRSTWIDNCNFLNNSIHYCDWRCPLPDSVARGGSGDFLIAPDATTMGVNCFQDDTLSLATGIVLIRNNLTGTIPQELEGFNLPGTLDLLWEINLYENILSGTIPWSIFGFEAALWITLVQNNLSGTITPRIGNFTNLVGLHLDSNFFTGSLPSELGNASSLRLLWLGNNMFSGTFPESVFNLPLLGALDAGNNMFSGGLPDFPPKNSTRLISVSFDQNWITGTIPGSISALTEILSLDLGFNFLSGTVPQSFASLANLEVLGIYDNRLTGSITSELWSMTQLEILNLKSNLLSGSISSSIGQLTSMRLLSFGQNDLSGNIPSDLGLLTNLEGLNLGFNRLSGMIPTELDKLSLVDFLQLSINNLSGNLNGLCEARSGPIQEFEADCFEDDVTCSCCIHCCEVPDDNVTNCPTWDDCCAAAILS